VGKVVVLMHAQARRLAHAWKWRLSRHQLHELIYSGAIFAFSLQASYDRAPWLLMENAGTAGM
jgi:hypothetical protein